MLSGLASWAYFDNNSDETVTSFFGSGCSSIITQAVNENRKNGRRTFIGLLDPSARPYFEEDILSFMIPMSRFKEMCDTMRQSCLLTPMHGERYEVELISDGLSINKFMCHNAWKII